MGSYFNLNLDLLCKFPMGCLYDQDDASQSDSKPLAVTIPACHTYTK